MIKRISLILIVLLSVSCLNAQDTSSVKVILKKTVIESESFDKTLFRKLNGHRTGFLDIVIPISEKPVTIPTLVVPISLYTSSRITDNYYDENSAALLTASTAVNLGVTYVIKQIFKRKRPLETLDRIYFDKTFFLANDRYSFPSGHASTSFNTATSLTLRYPDNPYLITGFYLRAVAISFGRIYMGVHYPGDVMTGALVGTGTAILIYSLRKEIIKLKADIFNQQERKEIGSDKVNQYVALGSIIAMDLVNYFILGQRSKITKNMHLELGAFGNSNSINFSYSF
jgi:membrane-associated phospholipid phosphatase